MKLMLQVLQSIGDKFKADYLINMLVGRNNALIKSYNHHKSEWFGVGSDRNDRFWGAVVRQALILGLVDKNIENYGLLSINAAGEEFVRHPHSVMIAAGHEYEDGDDDDTVSPPAGKGGVADEELYAMLKDLRKQVARQMELPPFVIFQDPSLEDMSIQYPVTLDEMQNITGVGAGKARKFGKPFVELIKKYCDEKDIVRPQDMVVKSVVNKSGSKVFIIQSIDRQMDFEDIARRPRHGFRRAAYRDRGDRSLGDAAQCRLLCRSGGRRGQGRGDISLFQGGCRDRFARRGDQGVGRRLHRGRDPLGADQIHEPSWATDPLPRADSLPHGRDPETAEYNRRGDGTGGYGKPGGGSCREAGASVPAGEAADTFYGSGCGDRHGGSEVTENRMNVRPKKYLGQHFLTDLSVARRIAGALRATVAGQCSRWDAERAC